MDNAQILSVMTTLLAQYNGQNDTAKPQWDEKYKYLLTEKQFDVIMNMGQELTDLHKILKG